MGNRGQASHKVPMRTEPASVEELQRVLYETRARLTAAERSLEQSRERERRAYAFAAWGGGRPTPKE